MNWAKEILAVWSSSLNFWTIWGWYGLKPEKFRALLTDETLTPRLLDTLLWGLLGVFLVRLDDELLVDRSLSYPWRGDGPSSFEPRMPCLDASILRGYHVLPVLCSEHPLHLGRTFGFGIPYNAVSFHSVGESHLDVSFEKPYASPQKHASVYGRKTYMLDTKNMILSNAKEIQNKWDQNQQNPST